MIRFDHNAGAPLRPAVRAAMAELLEQPLGNPSSLHGLGRRARAVVETARRRIGAAMGADPLEVTLTSGGTEANNAAVLGTVEALFAAGRPAGIVTAATEHPSVVETARAWAAKGHPLGWVDVDSQGRIEPAAVARAVGSTPEVGLVSIAVANHELGNRTDIEAVAAAVREIRPDLVVHTDAVQALGRIDLNFPALGVDLMTVSSHKIGGPAGIGALVHRKRVKLSPRLHGGGQERGLRVGTEAMWLAHGFGVAAEQIRSDDRDHVLGLHRRLRAGALALGATIHGDPEAHVGNTLSLRFAGCEGMLLMMNLDLVGFAVATGAACSTGSPEPSPVLQAIGLDARQAAEGLRLSLGPDNTAAEVDALLDALPPILERVRAAGATDEAVAR